MSVDNDIHEKRRQAAELRLGGASLQQIAERLGYASPAGAHQAVDLGLREAFDEPTSDIKRLELARLDRMLLGLWPKASRGDVFAVDRVLRIAERRAKYLRLDEDTPAASGAESDLERARRIRSDRQAGVKRSG